MLGLEDAAAHALERDSGTVTVQGGPAGDTMGAMPALMPGDNPQAYIPGDRRRALARGEDLPRRAHGSAVFVDISGFTPLTEALARELGGRRGAEELGATLDRIFAALMEPLHAWDGSVVYFSGDAVTAWIDGDDGSRATACGLAMQEVMARVGVVADAGRRAGHAGRQGRGGGRRGAPLRRRRPARPAHRRARRAADGLAGRRRAAVPAGRRRRSTRAPLAALGDRVDAARGPAGELGDGRGGRLARRRAVPAPTPPPDWPQLPEETARQWLLPPVWERMVAGRGEFLADLRPAVPVFVRFGGLDFERRPGGAGGARRLRHPGRSRPSTSRAAACCS